MFDWHSFDIKSSNYTLVIGKDFPGVVRKARINARSYCPDHTSIILSVNDPSKCQQRGKYKCQMCDLMEPLVTPAGTYACFPMCDNFKQYVDTAATGMNCYDCH